MFLVNMPAQAIMCMSDWQGFSGYLESRSTLRKQIPSGIRTT